MTQSTLNGARLRPKGCDAPEGCHNEAARTVIWEATTRWTGTITATHHFCDECYPDILDWYNDRITILDDRPYSIKKDGHR